MWIYVVMISVAYTPFTLRSVVRSIVYRVSVKTSKNRYPQ